MSLVVERRRLQRRKVAIMWAPPTAKITILYLRLDCRLQRGLDYTKTLIFSIFVPKISLSAYVSLGPNIKDKNVPYPY